MALDVAAPPRAASTPMRVALFASAVALVGLGVALMIEADLGVSPNDVANTGLAETTGMTVGAAAWTLAGICGALAWLLGRRATIATALASVGVGAGIDVALTALPTADHIVSRIAFALLGLAVIWIAITGIVATNLGIGPIELLMLALTDRRLSIQVARWTIELVLLGAGFLLGGSVGIGTAAFALGTGPVLARTIPWATARLGTTVTRPTDVAAAGP